MTTKNEKNVYNEVQDDTYDPVYSEMGSINEEQGRDSINLVNKLQFGLSELKIFRYRIIIF